MMKGGAVVGKRGGVHCREEWEKRVRSGRYVPVSGTVGRIVCDEKAKASGYRHLSEVPEEQWRLVRRGGEGDDECRQN
jgi:hypothetical protein